MIIEPGPLYGAVRSKTAEADIQALRDAIESGRAGQVADAIGALARSHGMTEVARATDMSRASLYKVLSENGNPTLETLIKVLGAVGLKLEVRPLATD